MSKAKGMTTGALFTIVPVVLPSNEMMQIEGIGGGLKGIYSVSSELANTLIKKRFATLKNK